MSAYHPTSPFYNRKTPYDPGIPLHDHIISLLAHDLTPTDISRLLGVPREEVCHLRSSAADLISQTRQTISRVPLPPSSLEGFLSRHEFSLLHALASIRDDKSIPDKLRITCCAMSAQILQRLRLKQRVLEARPQRISAQPLVPQEERHESRAVALMK